MSHARSRPVRGRGFTLIELIVAMAILGILASLAAPAFKDLMLDQRVKSASFDIATALTQARSEAIKQNGNVTLTPATNSTEWGSGWTLTAPDGATLATQGAYSGISITGPTSIVYNRTGRSTAATTVTLQVSAAAGGSSVSARCISVGVTGQPKSVKGNC